MDHTNYSYKQIPGGVMITDYHGRDAQLDIPAALDGQRVISLGRCAFFLNAAITAVTIPDTVTEIGFGAFEGCTSLNTVRLPQGLSRLGFRAFARCTSLEAIDLPDSLTQLEEGTFNGCTALAQVRWPGQLRLIGRNAFLNCTALPDITLPESVARIDGEAFCGCSGALTLTLPEGLQALGADAIKGCVRVSEFHLPQLFQDHLWDLRVGFGLMRRGSRVILGSFTYSMIRGVAVLEDYEGPGQELIVPDVIEGNTVGGISHMLFQNLDGLERVILPRRLSDLRSVVPEGVEIILDD